MKYNLFKEDVKILFIVLTTLIKKGQNITNI
jgi:hypothetical protein